MVLQTSITKTLIVLLCFGIVFSQDIPAVPLEPEEEETTTQVITTTTEEISTSTEDISTTTEAELEVTQITAIECHKPKRPFCFYYKSILKIG